MSLFDCKIARTKVEIISLLGSRRGFIQFPVRIKVVEGGIGFADPLGAGLKTSSWHLQTASGRLRFLFSTSGSSELDRLFRTKNPQR